MDESWRRTIGSVLPRQRSPDLHADGGHQGLAPDDFRDVFGGPPRTVLLRSFHGEGADYRSTTGHQYTNYGDAFCRRPYGDGRGQLAPAPAVPTEVGFFDDIFGTRHMRSRSRSKSKSSSGFSSEELPSGFCRPVVSGSRVDATLSSFTSRLRPVTIPSRRYDSSPPSTASTRGEYQSSFTCSTAAYPAARHYFGEFKAGRWNHSSADDSTVATQHHRHPRPSSSFCCFTSNPETTSNAPSFRRTRRARSPEAETTITDYSCTDYGYHYSPPSATSSSLFTNPLARTPRRLEEVAMEVRERAPLLMDDGDIDSVGAAAVDEAIAWAKERFWSQAN
ncbi:uncharacterized protein LOC133883169 [Phragmites australis]|uniref:uncharacterized protein LOC133883169 n=1 Tax=Phragmites australis TaxID=29695 RepID=UPI002D780D1A|nr:uncharacterized protein LOC133883169 [Phragmites australis]